MTELLRLDDVSLAYEVHGEGDPVILLPGCGEPALAFHGELMPGLVAGGYQVVTFDHRGMAPSSSPPAPYSIDQMADDTVGLCDHLGLSPVHLVGHSMGGWVAEVVAARQPSLVRSASFMGSCNPSTSWEKTITTAERDLAFLDVNLPPIFYATEILRYLPNAELQDDATVDLWVSLLSDLEPWPNPGRLGQYEACLAWSTNPRRTEHWPGLQVPCLVMAFEHDIDSPPARAREAANAIPGARYVEVAGASHLGPLTHGARVLELLRSFLAEH